MSSRRLGTIRYADFSENLGWLQRTRIWHANKHQTGPGLALRLFDRAYIERHISRTASGTSPPYIEMANIVDFLDHPLIGANW